jgi:phosphatidylserine decarboxylase
VSGDGRVEAFLAWLHASGAGRRVRDVLSRSRLLHAAIEHAADSRLSARLVPWAARRYGIDLAEAEVPPGGFPTFNAFFTRALRLGARPVDPDPKSLVSPADGHLLVLAPLGEEVRLPVKGAATPVAALLGDATLAAAYRGGAAAILRLYVPDCHRVVFPCAGVPDAPRAIPGAYHAVTPRPGNDVPFLARNRRAVSVLVSDAFGALAIVDVGGFLVGSIRHLYAPGVRVEKGAARSLFRFGGSTIVLLSARGRIRFRGDLLAASARGEETPVRMGEAIGWADAGEDDRPAA